MPKILALDPGEQHIGTALSDELQLLAAPYQTVTPATLHTFLTNLITQEAIETIVIGYPKTLRNRISQQTEKVLQLKNQLAQDFPAIQFILWDERLTSKSAQIIKPAKNKTDKLKQHSIAAAIILQGYLEQKYFQSDLATPDNFS